MKRILITGKDSYIGTSFEKWMSQYGDEYQVDTIDVHGDSWKDSTFSGYDVVFHVAGIAHASSDPKLEALYYSVNRDLTVSIAEKAKYEQVKQFIFMSSIIVYGDATNEDRTITRDTLPSPSDFYGDSKLQAEKGLETLADDEFIVSIIRPPMIYGPSSKGNYPKLAKLAQRIPFFPVVKNERSMLFVEHLCEFVKLLTDYKLSGFFYPQNKEYVNTSNMVKVIANSHNKRILLVSGFDKLIRLLVPRMKMFSKLFGSLKYDQSISHFEYNYTIHNFDETIRRTEQNA